MWEHYRKTFIPIQLVIVLICVGLHAHWGIPLPALAVFVLVMEVFAFLGAVWAMRLKRKITQKRGALR